MRLRRVTGRGRLEVADVAAGCCAASRPGTSPSGTPTRARSVRPDQPISRTRQYSTPSSRRRCVRSKPCAAGCRATISIMNIGTIDDEHHDRPQHREHGRELRGALLGQREAGHAPAWSSARRAPARRSAPSWQSSSVRSTLRARARRSSSSSTRAAPVIATAMRATPSSGHDDAHAGQRARTAARRRR